MSQELVYTSVPRGLAPGSQGFCTVACTRGMSTNLMQQLESLSGYRQLYSTQDRNAAFNPVVFSHLLLTVAGRRCHVLSRISDAGADYTGRSNKFAHHIVLDAAELPTGGPAWLLARDGFMRSQWNAEPCLLPTGPAIPSGDSPLRICHAWQQVTGDAGWAGVLAETAAKTPARQAVLVYQPGTDMLALLAEALSLLPKELRWGVSLCTYFTKLPTGVSCQWRCVADGTPEAAAARRGLPATLVLDLCRPLGQAMGGPLVEAARTGKMPAAVPSAVLPLGASPDIEGIGAGYELASVQMETKHGEDAGLTFGLGASTPVADYPPSPPPVVPSAPPPFRRFKPKQNPWPWVLAIAASILLFLLGGLTGWIVANWRTPAAEPAQVADATPTNESKKPEPEKPAEKPAETAAAPTIKAETPNKHLSAPEPQNVPKTALPPAQSQSKGEKAVDAGKEPQPAKPPEPALKPDAGDKSQQKPATEIQKQPPTDESQKKLEKKPEAKPKDISAAEKTIAEDIKVDSCVERDLPDIPKLMPQKSTPTIILSGDWTSAESLYLIGGNTAFGHNAKCELQKDQNNKSIWHCYLVRKVVGADSRDNIARFELTSESLGFSWSPNVPTDVKPDALRNCVLRITKGDKSQTVQLRVIEKIEPIIIEVNKSQKGFPIKINMGSNDKDVRMLLKVDAGKSRKSSEINDLHNNSYSVIIEKKVQVLVKWDQSQARIELSCSVPGDKDLNKELSIDKIICVKERKEKECRDIQNKLDNCNQTLQMSPLSSSNKKEMIQQAKALQQNKEAVQSRIKELGDILDLCTVIQDEYRFHPKIVRIITDTDGKQYQVVIAE